VGAIWTQDSRKQVTAWSLYKEGQVGGRKRGELFPARAGVPFKSFDRSQGKRSQMGPAHGEILSFSHSPAGRDGRLPVSGGKRNQCICGAEPWCHQAGSGCRAKDSAELQTLTFCVTWPRAG